MAYRDESAVKTALVKEIRNGGFYARRVEDQFAVGFLDMVVIAPTTGAVFIEAKLVKGGSIAATPRQRVEADRIQAAGGRACLLGYDRGTGGYFLGKCDDRRIQVANLLGRRPGETFINFLERYYHG